MNVSRRSVQAAQTVLKEGGPSLSRRRRLRRDMTKGQKAMAFAFIYTEGIKGKRSSETKHFSNARLSQARTVLRLSKQYKADKIPEAVLAGDRGGRNVRFVSRATLRFMPRKQCSICAPPDILRIINAELGRSTRFIDIAKLSGHSKSAIGRHSQRCLGREALRQYRDAAKAPLTWRVCWSPEQEAAAPADCGILRMSFEPLPDKLPNPRALKTVPADGPELQK
jgi:hypothetical protein